jgi:translation elongation factor 1 epsilon-1
MVGLLTVCSHLVNEAKRPELLGTSTEHRAMVHQWLEYRVTKVDGCTREEAKTVLKVEKRTRTTTQLSMNNA